MKKKKPKVTKITFDQLKDMDIPAGGKFELMPKDYKSESAKTSKAEKLPPRERPN